MTTTYYDLEQRIRTLEKEKRDQEEINKVLEECMGKFRTFIIDMILSNGLDHEFIDWQAFGISPSFMQDAIKAHAETVSKEAIEEFTKELEELVTKHSKIPDFKINLIRTLITKMD